ncbi:MAG: nucleotidyltransferase [Anaerovoracaceae bacterium]
MKVLGIIAEYNPFHNGHLYHLRESIKKTHADYTICVMSGNFTQRGEPAMADKWVRSQIAVANGLDLVLELPFAFACNNAEYFAKGAIDLLNRLGCVTHLSFGSESGDLELLSEAALHLAEEGPVLQNYIKEFTSLGYSFPKARFEAVKKYCGEQCAQVIKDANNILAVEYLKQLKRTSSDISPLTIRRFGPGYHDKSTFENIASASAIRENLKNGKTLNASFDHIPPETLKILQSININSLISLEDFYTLIMYRILSENKFNLNKILTATEGLENRVLAAAERSTDLDTLIKGIKSKRYTITRIQRLLCHILVNLTKADMNEMVEKNLNYARILAFNKKGAQLIKIMKKREYNQIPLLTNINKELPSDSNLWKLLEYDILASNIYNLVLSGEIYSRSDYIKAPYYHNH